MLFGQPAHMLQPAYVQVGLGKPNKENEDEKRYDTLLF